MVTRSEIDRVVQAALDEDAPWGDITCDALIAESARIDAQLVAREPGVLSGAAVFTAAMNLVDATTQTTFLVSDGDSFGAGAVLADVSGRAASVLRAERVGLNFVQRMCGVATLTRAYVDAVSGTSARIVDTRKTTPGLRALERHAVRCGGGSNHRFSLSDAVMVKDNHLAVLDSEAALDSEARTITQALLDARARVPHVTHIEVEVDRLDQIESVLAAGVDSVLLDNFTPADLRAGVRLVAGRAVVEASGGVTLESVQAIARSGVDVISVGALTHSVRALDLGLDVTVPDDGGI